MLAAVRPSRVGMVSCETIRGKIAVDGRSRYDFMESTEIRRRMRLGTYSTRSFGVRVLRKLWLAW